MAGIAITDGRRAFGDDPAAYDAARPGYPDWVFDRLAERGLRPGARVFEIGAGTGIATRRLLAAGAEVTAVEPDARLAAFLTAPGTARLSVLAEPFESAELPDAAFDLGVSATAFHWLDQRAALARVAQLLRPGGWWVMFANIFGDLDRQDAFHEATQDLLSGLPRGPSGGRSHTP